MDNDNSVKLIILLILVLIIFGLIIRIIIVKSSAANCIDDELLNEEDLNNDETNNNTSESNLIICPSDEDNTEEAHIYESKCFMTANEKNFYNKLSKLEEKYKIVPQINLASIINKKNSKYRTELFRNIDFAIFDRNYDNLLLLIELNDYSHKSRYRHYRDFKVKKICAQVGIKLIVFYTSKPNNQNYVINRIEREIESNDSHSTLSY